MRLHHLPSLFAVLVFAAAPAFAQTIVHNEAIDGELSDTGASPTLINLVFGLNEIQGSLGPGGSGATNSTSDADFFTFNLASGLEVSSITTTRSTPGQAFLGQVSGSTISSTTAAGLDGGVLFADGDEVFNLAGAQGQIQPISGPLSGSQTFVIQETGGATDFTISFNVTSSVPEPSSAAVVGGLALLGFVRRRKR